MNRFLGWEPIRACQRALRYLALTALLAVSWPCEAQTLSVIVSPDRAAITLDRRQLAAVFTMRLREWPDGKPINVFVMPDHSEVHFRFCREFLGIYPYLLRARWDRSVFTGTGLAPTTVESLEEMERRVRTTPGSIGYVSTATINFLERGPPGTRGAGTAMLRWAESSI